MARKRSEGGQGVERKRELGGGLWDEGTMGIWSLMHALWGCVYLLVCVIGNEVG